MQIAEFLKPIVFHKTLNPKLWDDEQLVPKVHLALLKIAKAFIEYLDIPNLPIKDIIVTGSNANYTYTHHSDFDLHIIVDMDSMGEDRDILMDMFNSKRLLWTATRKITIKKINVELYVEPVDDPVEGNAYSVVHHKWLRFDPPHEITYDDRAVRAKFNFYKTVIDHVIKEAEDYRDIEELTARLRRYRQSGLSSGGQYSVENLVFKALRNSGLLQRLAKKKLKLQSRELSI